MHKSILIWGFASSGKASLDFLFNKRDKFFIFDKNKEVQEKITQKYSNVNMERGIGLHILTDLAGRYHGSCTQEVRDGQFTVSVALQLPENQGETEEA